MDLRFPHTLVGASLLLLPGVALADEAGRAPASFWIEAASSGKACVEAASAITKELVLACDASRGACSVAKTREHATRTVRLHCGEDASATAEGGSEWTFTAYDRKDRQRWTINLFGADADLARSAAMFAVRFETDEEPYPPSRTREEASPAAATLVRAEPAATTPVRAEPGESASSSGAAGKVLAYSGFGVAVLALGSGLVLVLNARSKADDLEQSCTPHCRQTDVDGVRARYAVADALLVAGGVGAVVGTVGAILWARAPSSAGGGGKSVSTVHASAGAGWVGLAGSF